MNVLNKNSKNISLTNTTDIEDQKELHYILTMALRKWFVATVAKNGYCMNEFVSVMYDVYFEKNIDKDVVMYDVY